MRAAEGHNERITRVWHPAGPAEFCGTYGTAPVDKGWPSYQLHTGEIISL